MPFRSLPGARQAADGQIEALRLHASAGSRRGGPGNGSSPDLLRRLPRRTTPYDVLRTAARHQASPDRSEADVLTIFNLRVMNLRVMKRCEVEAGLGEEALEEAGPVLHPLETCPDQRSQLMDVVLGEVGQRSFKVRPDWLSRFVIVHGSLDRRLLAHRLSAGRGCSGWWSGPGSCGYAAREVDRRGRRGRGHLLHMTVATSVPDGELWASFPEATRNDILGLLGMLLERWAVSAGLAAEGSGGEHGAPR